METPQTFSYLASSFLVLIWMFSLWGFGACRYLHDKLGFIENRFRKKNLLRFRCWRLYRVGIYRYVNPFPILFYPTLLDYDVSLHILVVLVVVIPTSPRSSKTEFICKSYRFSRRCISGIPASSEFSDPARKNPASSDFSGWIPN